MKNNLVVAAFAAALAVPVAAPIAVFAQGTVRGAEDGIDAGNRAAGPVGGIVGGALGAATGTVGGILGVGDRPRFRSYVEEEHVRSYDYDRPVRAGVVLPDEYTYYDVPERFHVQPGYRYTVINRHPVIVEPRTRRVVEVLE